MQHSAPAVQVEQLTVERGGAPVLADLALSVAAGTVTGLLGPSGCGKSTLLRAIVGVQQVRSGRIDVLGLAAGAPALRRRVGYVTQEPSVYADLTVRENLEFFARVLGVARSRIDEVLELVGLEPHAGHLVGRLSGGQRSRASLAAALLGEPELLVLDEPTVGLDPVLRESLWDTFHALAAAGTTLLVSSHVMEEASRCDRLLLMRAGQVIADETPDGLRRRGGSPDLDQCFLAIIRASQPDAEVVR
ncbi:MAG: ybhF 2 [Thermoleophilia bacterium]|nr:ybhF 2 [Thermoleophilia bacterium]